MHPIAVGLDLQRGVARHLASPIEAAPLREVVRDVRTRAHERLVDVRNRTEVFIRQLEAVLLGERVANAGDVLPKASPATNLNCRFPWLHVGISSLSI